MDFQPLYYGDRLEVINPLGDVGIITLWSPIPTVMRKLSGIEPALTDPQTSRIAVIGNLYGDGILAMFCNLLNNPQIKYLLAVGEDMKLGVPGEIQAFLDNGLEDGAILGRQMKRIRGTNRYLPVPEDFDEQRLRETIRFAHIGKLSANDFAEHLRDFLDGLPVFAPDTGAGERVPIALKEPSADDFSYLPSDPLSHQVARPYPLDCWLELVYRVMRFGRPVQMKKGARIELQNVKTVIAAPEEEPDDRLEQYGFNPDRFRAYQVKILDPELPSEEISYTYGNRMRGSFDMGTHGHDALSVAIERLQDDPETRHAYVSLWDTPNDLIPSDLDHGQSVPCLTTLFFRTWNGRLTLTATYRAHNLLTAWLENVYGLMAVLRHVAAGAGIPPGPITVISQSLTINPNESRFPIAEEIVQNRKKDEIYDWEQGKYVLREDPHGYFAVSVDTDRGLIIADHKHDSVVINRYEGKTAFVIEEQIARDLAVSHISHALYLGRQLALAEQKLKSTASVSKRDKMP